jgi:uncharacterized protein YbjT (DUF2867 family)
MAAARAILQCGPGLSTSVTEPSTAILITGGAGTIGSLVVACLARKGAGVYALARAPERSKFPDGVTPVKGDLTDVDSMRAALASASKLFLLNAVVPDEITQALITLNLAREAGIQRIVYFSVFNSDKYTNVPHFTGKHAVERMIEQFDLPATILQPNYFMQNDAKWLKYPVLGHGVYPMPIGRVGLSMVDARDIAEAAALCLLRREEAPGPLPREVIELVGPDVLTGEAIAGIWTEVLNKPVRYGGDGLDAFEQMFRTFLPGWRAYDTRLMMERFQRDGMAAKPGDIEKLTALLGRSLRSYHDFAVETARQWKAR